MERRYGCIRLPASICYGVLMINTSYTLNQGTQPLSISVFLGFDADPSLNIAARIRGPNVSSLPFLQSVNHILMDLAVSVMISVFQHLPFKYLRFATEIDYYLLHCNQCLQIEFL